jgi:hypothetical protein
VSTLLNDNQSGLRGRRSFARDPGPCETPDGVLGPGGDT